MSKKTLPKFLEGMPYKTWKNKIDMWKIVTAVPKEQQAITLLLESLEDNNKAEKAKSELTASDVNDENGMKVLIEKLDKVFESDKINEAYLVYARFINFQKSDEMSMTDYITEFEHLYHKITNHEMPLPNTVLTFKLLDGAKLSKDERKLALTLGNNLKFETMKPALKRILTKSTIANESFHDTNNIKQEEAFSSKNMSKLKQNKTSKSSKSQKV